MDEASLIGSLDRLEAALERIEAAAREAESRAPAEPAAVTDDLELRHRQLKSAVEGALVRLDALIAPEITSGDEP